MAEKACHGLGSTTQVGLTQALDAMPKLLLAVTLITSQFIGTVLACTCPPPGSPQQEAAKSANTFVGTVISVKTISPPPPHRPYLFEEFFNDVRSLLTGKIIRPPEQFEPYQIVTFQVKRTFHGEHSPVRRINAGEVNSTCSYRFHQGNEYVVYTFNREGRLAAGQCTRTGLSSEAHAGYKVLANGI